MATSIILIHYLYLVAQPHQLYQYVWGHLDLATCKLHVYVHLYVFPSQLDQ